MKIAIISDLHANFEALRAVLRHADNHHADRFICLGDIVGYHSQVSETIDLLKSRGIAGIRGNHDLMATGKLEPVKCGPKAAAAIRWTRNALSDDECDYLDSLDDIIVDDRLVFSHSRLDDPVAHLWRIGDYEPEYRRIVERYPRARVYFSGHTHIQRVVRVSSGEATELPSAAQHLDPEEFFFINPGSVGYPRRADYRAAYALFDTVRWSVRFCRVRYNRDSLERANRENALMTETGQGIFTFMVRRRLWGWRRILSRLRS